LVIGVGNPDRGDDGVGRVVARLLRSHMPVGGRHRGKPNSSLKSAPVLRSLQHLCRSALRRPSRILTGRYSQNFRRRPHLIHAATWW